MSQTFWLAFVAAASTLIRCLMSLFPYSGQSKPPMFGDYEAQRHWMEITFNLKPTQWYFNSSQNDLNYWGLDYPPLTAYHSYLMGFIANLVNSDFVALGTSRGFQSYEHKLFMRASVLLSDLAIFYPSVFLLTRQVSGSKWLATALLALINPTLLIIDYCHFQYNCVSLGLLQMALFFLIVDKNLFASIFFVLALNYKQMELYHALPIFFYLLSWCVFSAKSYLAAFTRLFKLGFVVIVAFAVCWLPFITSFEQVLQVLHRVFPFARGLFEDKVSNFWCSLSLFVKLKQRFSIEQLSKMCLLSTFTLVLPTCFNLFVKASKQKLILSLINSSLVFFMFSFQVHEKSILLATIPACLLITHYPLLVTWFLLISQFSMYPLLYRDGATLPYFASAILFFLIVHKLFSHNLWLIFNSKFVADDSLFSKSVKFLFCLSMFAACALTLCQIFLKPPSRFPDLWPVVISFYSFIHFMVFAIIFHLIQFTLTDNNIPMAFNSHIFRSYSAPTASKKTKTT